MYSRLTFVYSRGTALARLLPIIFVLSLFGCGGGSSHLSPRIAASVPACTLASGTYVGWQQIGPCSNPSSGIMCGTWDGSTPASNGSGTGCMNGWALSSPGYGSVATSATLKIIAGVRGGSDSSVVSYTYTITAPPVLSASFGMQCGSKVPIPPTVNCYDAGLTPPIQWPTTQAQPGTIRLHDAQTFWSTLNPSNGTYDWTYLDDWLDVIAAHQPHTVIQTFAWVPCWASDTGTGPGTGSQSGCGIDSVAGFAGTNGWPKDLSSAGSPTFNAFVTAFVQHCSSAGNCVKDIIKNYEMWNEPNLSHYWSGTELQLYQMVAPAVSIIRVNVPGAVINTPSFTLSQTNWLDYGSRWFKYENTYGRVSDVATMHFYTQESEPEVQFPTFVTASGKWLDTLARTGGWDVVPWENTETNWHGAGTDAYICDPTLFTTDDCVGQIVRWQLMFASNGAIGVDWYKWLQSIGDIPQYEAAYYWMMQNIVGATSSAPCSFTTSGEIQTWTCDFTRADGTRALFVWTPTVTGTTYTVPAGSVDYLDLGGNTTGISGGRTITIGPEPIMIVM